MTDRRCDRVTGTRPDRETMKIDRGSLAWGDTCPP